MLLVPRKNGKSDLAARLGLYLFAADDEFGAEIYSGATTEKQAWEVFRPAKLMAEVVNFFRVAQRHPEAFCAELGMLCNSRSVYERMKLRRFILLPENREWRRRRFLVRSLSARLHTYFVT